jgi:cell division protein ZapA
MTRTSSNSALSVTPAPTLKVEIFGQFYNIRAAEDGDYLKRLAEIVDQRMREIARNSSTADSVKVAVLAALNIADELQRLKNQTQEADAHLAQRSAQYAQLLDGVLRSLNSLELAEASQPAEQAA